ncbi:MAG: class I SAM-dependent methyltransferase [Candidatus Diapherotrites archaeon]|nr:class I SAM-dependent methyltransferase [Candidatus Diapherotrites archaeon]
MGISSLIYDSWMKEKQYKKYSGILNMLSKTNLNGKILDVGMGTGLFEDYLKGKGIHVDVKGIEIDKKMMDEARKKGYDVALGSAEELPFESNSFDLVICIDTIHAVRDKERAIREIMRVLKPNGYALITHFCNTFTKKETINKMEKLTDGLDVVEKKIVGHPDDEISVAFLVRKSAL